MHTPRIAISGLHRGDNPQPGASIVRSIRMRYPDAFIVGLVYDAMESGIYVSGGPDVVYTMPYPTAGAQAFLDRVDDVLIYTPVDFLIPTLDAEIELLVHLEDELAERGILTYIPDAAMLANRSKNRLPALAERCRVATPETFPVFTGDEAWRVASEMSYPLMVKGQYYDAKMVHSEAEMDSAVRKLLTEWGAPAILQKCIHGPEFNVMGLGDGTGKLLGMCSIRKTVVNEKGKGQGGMTVQDRRLDEMVTKLIAELRWRGPFEVEAIKDDETNEYSLIEINPRFPAWVQFPAQFGYNFPAMLVEMMSTGRRPAPLPPAQPGYFYVRHQIEVLGHVDQIAEFSCGASQQTQTLGSMPGRAPVISPAHC